MEYNLRILDPVLFNPPSTLLLYMHPASLLCFLVLPHHKVSCDFLERVGGEQFCFSPSLQACGRVQWHAVQLTTACPPVKRVSWLSVAQGWAHPSVYLFVTRRGKNLWLLLVPRSPGIFFLLAFHSLSLVLLLASLQTISGLSTYFVCLLVKKREGVKKKDRL